MPVVVPLIGSQNVPGVGLVEIEDVDERFAPRGADDPFAVSVHPRSLRSAAMVLAVCAYPVLRVGAPRLSGLALAAVQALLPTWLELTGTETPAAALDEHLRLPPAWHHNAEMPGG